MKIDEPKTPYNYQDPTLNDCDQLDAGALAEKLKVAADSTSPGDDNGEGGEDGARGRSYYTDEDGEESGGDEEKLPETDEQKGKAWVRLLRSVFRTSPGVAGRLLFNCICGSRVGDTDAGRLLN